jgi:gas vesicle protein
VAAFMEVPVDMAAIFSLGAINAATIGRFKIKVKASYEETNALWLAVILGPGNRKSAAINQFFDCIKNYEKGLIDTYKSRLPQILTKNELIHTQIRNLKKQLSKKTSEPVEKIENEIIKLKCELKENISPPQLIVGDITSESMAEVMENNSERCAMVSDEGGIFDIIAGRYSNQIPNFDIYLQAYSGSSVKVNRRTHDKIICLINPALSITLSPQPIVINQILENALFRRRGFIGRFLLSVPNSPVGRRQIQNVPVSDDIKEKYEKRMAEIVSGINFKKEIF